MKASGQLTCVCGFVGNNGHTKSCYLYTEEVKRVKTNIDSYIEDYYKETYSITDCCEYVKKKEVTGLYVSKIRQLVNSKLDTIGVREKLNGENLNKKRQEKLQKTMIEKYGVINNGQRDGQGFKQQNTIPYVSLKINSEMAIFKKKVDQLSWKQLDKLKRLDSVPLKCYYTDIPFADTMRKLVNPNDPFKRTVDHKTPVTEAFFLGWTPEQTASDENLVYCLRIVNTVKGNTTENRFREILLPRLKEKLENEDY